MFTITLRRSVATLGVVAGLLAAAAAPAGADVGTEPRSAWHQTVVEGLVTDNKDPDRLSVERDLDQPDM